MPRLPGSDGRLGLAPPTASACHAPPPSGSDLSGTCGPKYLGIKDLSRFEKGKRDRKKVLVRKLAHSMGLCQYRSKVPASSETLLYFYASKIDQFEQYCKGKPKLDKS